MNPALRNTCTAALVALSALGQSRGEDVDWVALEGGCFTIGAEEGNPEERPQVPACVEPFSISRTEITNAQFTAFVEATGYRTRAERGWKADEPGGPGIAMPPGAAVFAPPSRPSREELDWWRFVEGANWQAPKGPGSSRPSGQLPVIHVTREDAEAYADWAGARLPTEEEWEFAARAAPDGSVMRWTKAEAEALNKRANTWQGLFPAIDTGKDGFEGLAPVASFEANAFGLHDMMGNVWEWTATPYAPSHRADDKRVAGRIGFDPNQPGAAVATIKGGSYLCSFSYCARFRPAARQAQNLAYGTSHIGFRIVR
ncbi:formylglycine-generating enzyme family protein [Parvularcula sp. ZS-1/3]|uniref:Formylglycine-generating enzyme family protein n=1 Tax=Parvularcula mediterranea TaxID=2732508 RepID=A0A7Y3RMB3_9PROT|nr:formylglycine-generating enzyme family protein [Parvularcula mediterranea]NNU16230.1 formylglycine-generating enzyme family protein [Parvularcula mediterranea]